MTLLMIRSKSCSIDLPYCQAIRIKMTGPVMNKEKQMILVCQLISTKVQGLIEHDWIDSQTQLQVSPQFMVSAHIDQQILKDNRWNVSCQFIKLTDVGRKEIQMKY